MKSHPALSVIAPAGDLIRSGKKTLEIRQWIPESIPLRDLVIVQNKIRLSRDGVSDDPDGDDSKSRSHDEWHHLRFDGGS